MDLLPLGQAGPSQSVLATPRAIFVVLHASADVMKPPVAIVSAEVGRLLCLLYQYVSAEESRID